MTSSTPRPDLQLPGYTLLHRIGSGGYGEVWRASAPGGLVKAVKIVFGRSDQSHATSELRALEKIKSVRHPFLLSLERFEIVEGRLVVVMELADGSLRDRYRECRDAGQPGISRDELLRYLRDAADALDYLAQKHDLQHLDVKPENLLLVGGHVKIADFGLVKDLHAPQASIIGGMTPTYAAPELFQGRPTPHSDQYSLAIIYQELLTGTMPFEGTSAAELTLKHINELPSLDPLSESDRFVISQALAKDPDHRFGSCSEMVEALIRVAPTTDERHQLSEPPARAGGDMTPCRRRSTSLGGPAAPTATLLFDEEASSWARETAPVLIELPEIEPLQIVPAPRPSTTPWAAPPTLVIGVGGAGRLALKSLRTALSAALPGGELPATLRTLLIDTNPQSMNRATSDADGEVPLSADEVICCPLRKPQDYRDKSDRLLKWMPRRWLYNIPRSLRTEGIRPLGRLAFVDHARVVMQKIRAQVEQLESPHSTANPREGLRIYFVGSISGGTASGMLNDLAYATRAMLKHLSISAAELIAVTTHSPSRISEMMELSRVNSFAWLSELAHWCRVDQLYPGDETAGIPPVEEPTPPFDHVYVLDLGDRVDDRHFLQAAHDIADYILLDAASPAGQWIGEARRRAAASTAPSDGFKLRTFAVRRSPEVDEELLATCTQKLLGSWGPTIESSSSLPMRGETPVAPDMPTTVAHFASLARGIVEAELGVNVVGYLGGRMKAAGFTPSTLTVNGAVDLIDQIVPRSAAPAPATTTFNGKCLQVMTEKAEAELAARASRWFSRLAADPNGHPREVLRRADEVSELLATIGDQLQGQVEAMWRAIEAGTLTPAPGETTDQFVLTLWRQRIQWVFGQVALQLCEAQSKCIEAIAHNIDSLLQCCRQSGSSGTETKVSADLMVTIDQRVRAKLGESEGYHGLWSEAGSRQSLEQHVGSLLPAIIRSVALEACDESRAPGPGDPWQLRSLGPRLRFQGGECSQLVVGPDPQALFHSASAVDYVQVADLTRAYTVFEAGGLSPLHVAATFVSGRRDYADMAGRVATRNDVNWRALLGDHTHAESATAVPMFPVLVHDTQALCVDSAPFTASSNC